MTCIVNFSIYIYIWVCNYKWYYTISASFVQEYIKPLTLFVFWLEWCWEWVMIHVHLFWWPNGETRQNDIHAIYVSPVTKFLFHFYTFQAIFVVFFTYYEWHIRYISPQRHMCRSSEWHMRYMWLHRYYLALIFGSDNGSVPVRRQVIILTNAGAQLIWPFGTNCIEIWILIQFSHTKMNSKMKCRKWRPFHLGFNALNMSISSMRCLSGKLMTNSCSSWEKSAGHGWITLTEVQ